MAPGLYHLFVYQGATARLLIERKDGANAVLAVPAGYLGRGQIRASPSSAVVLATFTVSITNYALGRVEVLLPATALDAANIGTRTSWDDWYKGSFDVELYDPASTAEVIRLLHGPCWVSAQVTRV